MINLKNLKNLKQGFKDLTPIQIVQSKMWCYAGMAVGAALATIKFFQKGEWGLGIFLFFIALLQVVTFKAERQSYKGLKEFEKELQNQQTIDESIKEEKEDEINEQ